MVDDSRAINEAVKETPQAPMPSAEQKTSTGAETQVQSESAVQVPIEQKPPPEASSEHAREQWERLQGALRKEKETRLYYENIFADIQAQQQSGQPKQERISEIPPIYDPTTGLINEKAFEQQQREIEFAKQAAAEAREQAIQARMESEAWRKNEAKKMQNAEEEEAFKAYPELDYKNTKTLDKEFHKSVRAFLLDSMVNPADYGGKQLTYKQAADLAKGSSKQVVEKAKEEGAKKVMENLQPKEQASLEVEAGNASNRSSIVDMEDQTDLAKRTRKGDLEAIVLRMRRLQTPQG